MQMQETVDRVYHTSSMIDHMDTSANKLNHIFSMAGVGIPVDSVVVVADSSRFVFRTFWNCETDTLSDSRHLVEIKLNDDSTDFGRVLEISQDGSLIEPLGYIMYIEDIKLKYYNKHDVQTTNTGAMRYAEVLLTFRRDSSWRPDQPLRSNLQLKLFLMNSYLQGG